MEDDNGKAVKRKREKVGARRRVNRYLTPMTLGDKIKAARLAKGLSQTDLAKLVRQGQSAISALERGETDRPRFLPEIAKVLGLRLEELLPTSELPTANLPLASDPDKTVTSTVAEAAGPVVRLPIVGEVQAGMFVETLEFDSAPTEYVEFFSTKYPRLPRKAWRVVGNSMDLEGFADGAVIITVPYFDAYTDLQNGKICVLSRTRPDGRIERTCKAIAVLPGPRYELRPRSSDPRHETIAVDPSTWRDQFDFTIEVEGLVIWTGRDLG